MSFFLNFFLICDMSARAAALAHGFLGPRSGPGSAAPPLDVPVTGTDDGQGLRDYVLKEFKYGRMTSEAVCTFAWHATRAGALGIADFALNPKSHHQAEFLRSRMHARAKESFYLAKVPVWNQRDQQREVMEFPMNLPHEAFAKAFPKDPAAFDPEQHDGSRLPRLYYEHEVYKNKQGKASPVGYFSDAVPHTHRDSFFAFYWSSVISGERFMICSLRKQDVCQCGCAGYCTMGPIMKVIAWSFNCLAAGLYPEIRHDGVAMQGWRAGVAGSFLADGFCGALVEMRADLLEIIGALGFSTPWVKNAANPCFMCDCGGEQLFDFPLHFDFDEDSPVQLRGLPEYSKLVAQAVLIRTIESQEVLDKIRELLHFDGRKGKDGNGPGLTMKESFVEADLPEGARLMVDDLPGEDIHRLAELVAPVTLTFFNPHGDHGLTFVTPLFSIVGFSIECIHLDVMHVLDLGVSQYLVGMVLRRLVEGNVAGCPAGMQVGLKRFKNILYMRRRLAKYYGSLDRSRGTMSAIGRLQESMLGPMKIPKLASKAAECRNLVPLMVELCNESYDFLGDNKFQLKVCAQSLHRFYQVMKLEPREMTPGGLHELRQSMVRFLVNWRALGGHMVYKHHAAWHLVQRAASHGNPKFYWTYADEQENRVMGTVAKGLSGCRDPFYLTFLQKVLPEHT